MCVSGNEVIKSNYKYNNYSNETLKINYLNIIFIFTNYETDRKSNVLIRKQRYFTAAEYYSARLPQIHNNNIYETNEQLINR